MTTFAAVNSGLSSPPPSTSSNMSQPAASNASERMSTTPPPEEKQSQSHPAPAASSRTNGDAIESSPNTPTRHSFAGMLGQRPLPSEPLSADCAGEPIDTRSETSSNANSLGHRAGSQAVSTPGKTPMLDSGGDVEMGEGDEDDEDGSENESVTSESQRPSKKKKGQRFFCTEYPPCQLSFTRSEHLARHIRKHTGERPFQCHCSRRFSRLDNLRQHAQTVHVNEDIPGDSLAATSTRFQRQIRTDRVRPAGSRSRASTLGSQGGHSRGHSRNLSASSIASTVSNMSISEDVRRRPQPLAMAGDGASRVRLSLETYGGPPPPTYGYYNNQSPTGYSTPTSTTYQNGNVTSHFQPGVASPSATISRSSVYDPPRGHTRRLSQPSTSNPYQQPQGSSYPPPYYSPSSNATFSPQSSAYASPTSSVFSHSRRESESEMDYRRRTWHPSTNSQYAQRPATSGLTYHQTPDQPRPAFSQQPAASQLTRLPGIESFDHAPLPAARQHPSPLPSHEVPRPTSSGRTIDGLHHGLTRLDITTANGPPPEASAVPSYHAPPPPGYLQVPSHQQQHGGQPPASSHYISHSRNMSMPEGPITPRRNKRNAWYGGPVTPSSTSSHGPPAPPPFVFPARPSPEDSGSSEGVQTPSLSHAVEHHPVIYNPSGHHHGHRHHNSTSSIGGPGSTLLPPPPFEEKRSYYPSSPQKPDQPVRADSGFQSYPPQLTSQQPQHHHQPPPPATQQPTQQPSQQFPPQTYALQTGHDPSFAQANHGAGGVGNKPSDSARLDVLVTAALSSSNGTRATSHPS